MLICHCNVVTEREIRDATRALLRDDPWELIVPAKLYRELGKRGRCCGCFPNVVDIITRVTEEYHLEIADLPAPPAQGDRRPPATPRNHPGDGT